MNNDDKLVLGTLAGVDLVLSPEHYEEYKGTLNKQLEEKDKEINRLNNIINELEKRLEFDSKDEENHGYCEPYIDGCRDEASIILDYLKELKENNNGK